MNSLKLASGDSHKSSRFLKESEESEENKCIEPVKTSVEGNSNVGEITSELIENNETKVKERIAECRSIIESLKYELSKEKSKLEKETKINQHPLVCDYEPKVNEITDPDVLMEDVLYSSNRYRSFIDEKLSSDENVMEYEKQLQKYQNTLNMAQIEKKNAIRKQMLAKAFKLKLLEVENQCNIELLRVKQSLQCLEPLQMIVNKWKSRSASDATYDLNSFELNPRFPELNVSSGSDFNSYTEDDIPLPEKLKIICARDGS